MKRIIFLGLILCSIILVSASIEDIKPVLCDSINLTEQNCTDWFDGLNLTDANLTQVNVTYYDYSNSTKYYNQTIYNETYYYNESYNYYNGSDVSYNNTYTKSQIDSKLNTKASIGDYALKSDLSPYVKEGSVVRESLSIGWQVAYWVLVFVIVCLFIAILILFKRGAY